MTERTQGSGYSIEDLARLTGVRTARLRRWHDTGFLKASQIDGRTLTYSFTDLKAARTVVVLLEQGVSPRQLRDALEMLRGWRPELAQPLASVRIIQEQGRIVVRLEDALIDTRSGQMLLDLHGEGGDAPVVEVERRPEDAQGWLDWALSAESVGASTEVAEARYRKALALDPSHPGALINLGNLLFERGELAAARDLYRKATESAPNLAEAWYNLANVQDDLGQVDAAVAAYQNAVSLDPAYTDAHFNLALVWEKQGQRERARPHWLKVVALYPRSEAAATARRFLTDNTDR